MRNDEPSSSDDTEAPAPKPSIGEVLRATREFRRASIEHVSELLRIEPRFLVALEEERFDAIGPPVFVKGYVKHYCELLGIDSRPLLDELRLRLGGAEPPLQARRPAERDKQRNSSAMIVVAVAVAALAAVALWLFRGSDGDDGSEPEVAALDLPAQTVGTSEVRPERSAQEGTGPAPAAFATRDGAASAGTALARPSEAADPEPVAVSEPGAEAPGPAAEPEAPDALPAAAAQGTGSPGGEGRPGVEPPDAGSAPGPASSGIEAGASSASSGVGSGASFGDGSAASSASTDAGGADARAPLEIELRFVEDSWTEVTAAGGERLFYGLARAGAEERILADTEVRVLLGNADGVIVRVNGAPFAYPSGSRNGELARFRLSPEN